MGRRPGGSQCCNPGCLGGARFREADRQNSAAQSQPPPRNTRYERVFSLQAICPLPYATSHIIQPFRSCSCGIAANRCCCSYIFIIVEQFRVRFAILICPRILSNFLRCRFPFSSCCPLPLNFTRQTERIWFICTMREPYCIGPGGIPRNTNYGLIIASKFPIFITD